MKRVLSLLLLIPFLVTQAWAIRGGPYESGVGTSQASLAGTYGISLQGTETAGVNCISTTGILTLAVPLGGLVKGSIVIFDKGLMYLGTSFGHLDVRSGKMKLLAQASHYAVIAIQNTMYTPVVDYNLSGQVNLDLSVDYFSGLIVATGGATFARSEPLAAQVTNNAATDSVTKTTTNSTGTATTGPKATSVQKTNVVTVIEPDGSTTTITTTETSGTTGPDDTSSGGATTAQTGGTTGETLKSDIEALRHNVAVAGGTTVKDSNNVTVTSTSGLKPGMSISGPGIPDGTTIVKVIDGTTIQLSKPATADATDVALAANADSVIFLTMTAEGIREETTISPLPIISPPTTQSFQIGVAGSGLGSQ